MDRLRAGILGTGGIFYGWGGDSGHLPAYTWVEEAELVALCDPNERALKRAEAATRKAFDAKAKEAEEAGDADRAERLRRDAAEITTYTDLAAMLSDARLDLLDVISPASTHAAVCIEGLRAGAHVMCEKPLTRTWIEAVQIADAVEDTGKLLQYSENLIFADPWQVVRNCIDAGAVGEVLLVYLPLAIGSPGNFSYTRDKIGALLDMASHAITLSWFLVGFDKTPVRVKAVDPYGISVRMPNRQDSGVQLKLAVEDDAHFLVEYEDPAAGTWHNTHLEGSWSYRDSPETQVLGTTGSIRTDGSGAKIIDAFGGERTCAASHPSFLNQQQPPGFGGYAQQVKNMCQCILRGAKPQCNERVAADSMAIAGAAYLSQVRGRAPVTIEEFKAHARQLQSEHGDGATDALLDEALNGIAR